MKKIAVVLLLFIFLFNAVGYFIAFKTVQFEAKNEIREQIKNGIKTDFAVTITINKADLANVEFYEGGEEMLYNNEMYDIVKRTESSTEITLVCLNDSKETSLFANLEEHISNHVSANTPVQNKNTKNLTNDVVKIFFKHEQSFSFHSTSSIVSFPFVNLLYSESSLKTNSPPPEFV